LRFGEEDLKLEDDMEEVLFKWAFAKPRNGKENLNVLEIAEDFRVWHQMAMYDDKKNTRFAKRLDVKDPDNAERIREVEIDYAVHKQRMSGVSLLTRLVGEFGELKAEALKEQASHFKPLLEQVVELANDFLKMIDAVEPPAVANDQSGTS